MMINCAVFSLSFSCVEPNEDWTVEEVFQWTLLRSYKLYDERYQTIAEGLRGELNDGGKELEEVRKEVSETKQTQQQHQYDVENRQNNEEAIKSAPAAGNTIKHSTRSSVVLQAKVIESDYYMGRVFELKITKKGHCLIGRSSSKKFKTNGISLSKDLEVSTTHGKFELHKDGNVYYVDTGSTNGSKVDGTSLEADAPCSMQNGTIVLVGATKFEIKIL